MIQTAPTHHEPPAKTGERILAALHALVSEDLRLRGVPLPLEQAAPLSPEQRREEARRIIDLRSSVDRCVHELVRSQNTAALSEQHARTLVRELHRVDAMVKDFAEFLRGHTGELRATRDVLKLNVSSIPTCPDVVELFTQAKATLSLPDSGVIDPSNIPQDAFVLLTRFRDFRERTHPIRTTLSHLHERATTFSKDAKERLRHYDELRSEAKELRERLERAESKGGQAAERFKEKLAKIEMRRLKLPAEDEARVTLEREMNTIIDTFSETYRQVSDEMALGSFDSSNSIQITVEAEGLSPLGARIAIARALLKRELLTIDPASSPNDPSQTRLDHLRSLIHRIQHGDARAACAMYEWGEFRDTLLLVTFIITLTNPADLPVREFVSKVKGHWLAATQGNDFTAITPVLETCFDRVANHVTLTISPPLPHEPLGLGTGISQ